MDRRIIIGGTECTDDASDAEWFELGEIINLDFGKTVEIINKVDMIRKSLVP